MSKAQESLKLRIDGIAGPASSCPRNKNCDDRPAHFSSSTLTIPVQNFQPMHASCTPLASLDSIAPAAESAGWIHSSASPCRLRTVCWNRSEGFGSVAVGTIAGQLRAAGVQSARRAVLGLH